MQDSRRAGFTPGRISTYGPGYGMSGKLKPISATTIATDQAR
jgi:hypothetical protein